MILKFKNLGEELSKEFMYNLLQLTIPMKTTFQNQPQKWVFQAAFQIILQKYQNNVENKNMKNNLALTSVSTILGDVPIIIKAHPTISKIILFRMMEGKYICTTKRLNLPTPKSCK